MSVYSIQFFNDIFFKQFAYSVFWVSYSFVKNLRSFLLYIASDAEHGNSQKCDALTGNIIRLN